MNVLFLLLFVPAAALTALRAPDEFLPALLAGAGKAVTLCLTLAAVYAVWMGFMQVAQDAGAVRLVSRGMRPLTRRLFKTDDPAALDAAALCMTANFLGMGSAATPAGLRAMERMAAGAGLNAMRLLGRAERPGYARAMLFAVNCAGVQLLPTTALAVRMQAGSAAPYDVVLPALLAECAALLVGAALVWLFYLPPFEALARGAKRRRGNEPADRPARGAKRGQSGARRLLRKNGRGAKRRTKRCR